MQSGNDHRPFRLDVPITDDERTEERDDSNEFLLRPGPPYEHSRESQPSSLHPSYDSHELTSSGGVSSLHDQHGSSWGPSDADHTENHRDTHHDGPEVVLPRSRSGYAPVSQSPQLWRPLWLRKVVLLSFTVLFAGLLAALFIIRHYVQNDQGFGVAQSTSHYTWTYLPTTVLVVLVALWRPVDYYCKSLTPWAELRRGPISASKSVLLDYISPFQIFSCIKATRHGHWAVVASITAFSILKLMVRMAVDVKMMY